MEVKFNSLSVIVQFISTDECKSLIKECPDIIQFILDGYQNARAQPDYRTTLYESRYPADSFLRMLRALCSTSDEACSEVVRLSGLKQLALSLVLDPNVFVQGCCLYWQVLFGAFIIWHILLAENGRYRENLRKISDIQKGV